MKPFLLVLAACLPICVAQQETVTFRAGTSQVRVDVQVIDKGKPVSGLNASDFVLRDQDVVQPVVYFGRESEPLQVVLLLDCSGSMSKMLNDMAAVGQKALGTLKEKDEVAILLFTRATKLSLELTTDKIAAARLLKDAVLDRGLGSGSALNVAVLETANFLKDAGAFPGRRAILALTDNGSLSHQAPDETVLRALAEVNAVLNAIVPSNAKPPAPIKDMTGRNPDFAPHDVFKLARLSGGEVLRADKAGERFEELMEHMRVRYSLVFSPPPDAPPGTFRRLSVELSPGTRAKYPKAEVRARAGYFTAKAE